MVTCGQNQAGRPTGDLRWRTAMSLRAAVLLTLLVSLTVQGGLAEAAARPNVVLVMTDDQGYGDLSCHGNPVLKTPYLDRLHAESVRLTDYHVAPTCSPTRAALMTGHWSNRTGAWHTILGRSLIRENEVTLGQVFHAAGYATGMFGKWHLGDNAPSRPEDRGFSEVMRHGGGGVGQTPDWWDNAYFDGTYWHNRKPEPARGYCTDVWFQSARQFILEQKRADRPFVAYIATNAPHGPNHAPEEAAAAYEELGTGTAHFFGMIANIDENVGRLRAFLDEQGLTENTIFIFTTDNGTAGGAKVHNAGLRGAKGSEYDGGHRVPCFIHWPAGGLTGGRDVADLAAHVDMLPTLIDLCGIAGPEGVRFDGRSVRPLLEGKASLREGSWPDRMLVTDSQRLRHPKKWKQSAVMTSRWRLINGSELFDIQADPGQKTDVGADHPETVARLRRFYEQWWAELEPTFADDVCIWLGDPRENPARLTCHDWITDNATPWNQSAVRRAQSGPDVTGFWNVRIVADGEYVIRLRRWPAESGAAIDAALPAGADVPGVKAYRTQPGVAVSAAVARLTIGEQSWEAPVAPGSPAVELRVPLKAGETRMSAVFVAKDGAELGAFYADVELLK